MSKQTLYTNVFSQGSHHDQKWIRFSPTQHFSSSQLTKARAHHSRLQWILSRLCWRDYQFYVLLRRGRPTWINTRAVKSCRQDQRHPYFFRKREKINKVVGCTSRGVCHVCQDLVRARVAKAFTAKDLLIQIVLNVFIFLRQRDLWEHKFQFRCRVLMF